jgi:hypothetical protein
VRVRAKEEGRREGGSEEVRSSEGCNTHSNVCWCMRVHARRSSCALVACTRALVGLRLRAHLASLSHTRFYIPGKKRKGMCPKSAHAYAKSRITHAPAVRSLCKACAREEVHAGAFACTDIHRGCADVRALRTCVCTYPPRQSRRIRTDTPGPQSRRRPRRLRRNQPPQTRGRIEAAGAGPRGGVGPTTRASGSGRTGRGRWHDLCGKLFVFGSRDGAKGKWGTGDCGRGEKGSRGKKGNGEKIRRFERLYAAKAERIRRPERLYPAKIETWQKARCETVKARIPSLPESKPPLPVLSRSITTFLRE